MNVSDVLKKMECRALGDDFQKDICALYAMRDYGDTEPDCELGYQQLLPLLCASQKMSMEKMESAYTQRREYAARYSFHCGLLGAFRQFFDVSDACDGGFQDLVCDELLTQPKMQHHTENYANVELCNQLESSIMDTLSDSDADHLVSITCAWQQRVYSAAHDGFFCGYIAGYNILESLFPDIKATNHAKERTIEYFS